jgi:dihydropteroate synthase
VFAAEVALDPMTGWRQVADELAARLAAMPAALRGRTIVDPGLGFGKGSDPAGNLGLLAHAGALGQALDRPVLVGASRKRFLARLLGATPTEAQLDAATVGASLAALAAGAQVVRVHEVASLAAAVAAFTAARELSP